MNEQEAFEQFGRFIAAFKSMDAGWRRGVLKFLIAAHNFLSEGREENEID